MRLLSERIFILLIAIEHLRQLFKMSERTHFVPLENWPSPTGSQTRDVLFAN